MALALLVISFILAVVGPILVIFRAVRQNPSKGLLFFVYSIGSVFIIEMGHLVMFLTTDPDAIMVCVKVCAIGKLLVVFFVPEFISQYTKGGHEAHRRLKLTIVNVIVAFTIISNDTFHWYIKDYTILLNGPKCILQYTPGPGYYLYVFETYCVVFYCMVKVIRTYLKERDHNEIMKCGTLGVALLLPVISMTKSLVEKNTNYSLLSISLIISSILALICIEKLHMFDLTQNAKEYVLDHSFESIIVLDAINKVLYMNDFVKKYSKDVVLYKKIFPRYEYLLDGELHRFDAIDKQFEAIAVPIYYKDGKIQGRILEIREITEREKKRAEKEELRMIAEKANQAKSLFLSNMSHEIRTPISAVLGMDEMIIRESEDETVIEYAENIQEAGKTLLSLINDILDFSKIESGEMEIVPVSYDVRDILKSAKQLVESRLVGKNVSFSMNVDSSIPRKIFGDNNRVQQVLVNILTNAAKYTLEGSVLLEVKKQPGTSEDEFVLEMSVKDTGIGIKKEDIGKLFQTFQRVDEEKNRNIEGTGLGLAITKKLAERMGGKIKVESEYGVGSTFTIQIPQKIIDKTPIGKGDASKSKEGKTKYKETFHAPEAKILVVDDNKVNIKVIVALLKNTQVKITSVESGMECLEKCRKHKYDLILMDHLMPEMDGIETLHRIQKDEDIKDASVPVIVLTANAMQGVREMYLEKGFCDYLMKPVNSAQLEEMIIKYLPKDLVELVENETE